MKAQGTWAKGDDDDDDDESHWHRFFKLCAEEFGWTPEQTANITLAQLPYVLCRSGNDPAVIEDPSDDEMAAAAEMALEE